MCVTHFRVVILREQIALLGTILEDCLCNRAKSYYNLTIIQQVYVCTIQNTCVKILERPKLGSAPHKMG